MEYSRCCAWRADWRPDVFNPRPNQKEILSYTHGFMGVSAVPGSGKTHTLSRLAANLISSNVLDDNQEILIVTLVNSAVDNFTSRIAGFMTEFGLLPDLGYRVRTLHGLAHDLVKERPDLAGLSDRFTIVDERETEEILTNAVRGWLRAHPGFAAEWLTPDVDLDSDPRTAQSWENGLQSLAKNYIRQAKDLQATPHVLIEALSNHKNRHSLLDFGLDIYTAYQRALSYRSAVDFDDLIRLALLVLQSDPDYLLRLRHRWPFILEDEAQDSSLVQEQILSLLSGDSGNWVRVGDPNQAIYETFTTASPEHLRRFLRRGDVIARDLPDSGRSQPGIIRLANELIRWTMEDHPVEDLQNSLTIPLIRPTPPGDPQPNPPNDPAGIVLYDQKLTPSSEIDTVVRSVKAWIGQNPDKTVAVLAPRNKRLIKMADDLHAAGIETVELMNTSQSTRQTAVLLQEILEMLAKPVDAHRLAKVYKGIHPERWEAPETRDLCRAVHNLISRNQRVEDFLWPRTGTTWLENLTDNGVDSIVIEELDTFQQRIRRWHEAVLLPIDQLILTIAQDLFVESGQLALAHKIALMLERSVQTHPDWHLWNFAQELADVAANQRRLEGFSEEEIGFDPNQHKGKVAIATIHKAKGLEWDRVYLLSVSNYDFPSAQEYDQYMPEKYFIRGKLNLEAEALSRLKAVMAGDPAALYLEEGAATVQARLDYCAERLRLFYVGITRARRMLTVTWNNGQDSGGARENQASLPFVHLSAYWKETRDENSR